MKRSRSLILRRYGYEYSVAGLSLFAAVIRLFQLGRESLWLDEALGVLFASQPLRISIDSMLQEGLQHSPLFYILSRPFVTNPVMEGYVRLLPVIAGVLAIPLIAQLGRRLFSARVGLLAATFLAFNPYHVWYSREARMYSLLGFLSMLTMAFFAQIALGEGTLRHYFGLAISLGAALNTHHFAHFIPMVQFSFLLASFRRTYPALRRWVIAISGAYLSLLPWAAVVLSRGEFYGSGGTSRTVVPADLWKTLWNFSLGYTRELTIPISITIAISVSLAIFGAWKTGQSGLFLMIWLSIPILVTFFLSLRIPLYMDRYLMVAFPAYILLLSAGIDQLHSSRLRLLATIGLILVTLIALAQIYWNRSVYERADWRSVGVFLEENVEPEQDIVATLYYHDLVPLHFYYMGTVPIRPVIVQDEIHLPPTGRRTPGEEEARLWLVIPNPNPTEHLAGHCDAFKDADFIQEERIIEWRRDLQPSLIATHHFACIRLEEYELE